MPERLLVSQAIINPTSTDMRKSNPTDKPGVSASHLGLLFHSSSHVRLSFLRKAWSYKSPRIDDMKDGPSSVALRLWQT